MSFLVSIIIPTYNRSHLICDTLDSVINQTYDNWECIIVDDGSTDNTVEQLKKYCSTDKRFQFFLRPNEAIKGASTCRNIGLFKAIGECIIFLDSDDYLVKDCLFNRVLKFEENSGESFLVFPMGVCNYNNNIVTKKEIEYKKSFLIEFLKYKLPWSIMCPIWKREFLIKLKGFKEGYPRLNDPELMIRALLESEVKFKVFNEMDYDTIYYPSVANWTSMIDKYFDSLKLFIPDIVKELELRNKMDLKHYLSSYLKVWFRDFMLPNGKNLIKQNKTLIFLFYKYGINSLPKTILLAILFYLYIMMNYIKRKLAKKIIEVN
ncbi:MAG: glycosyltransferase [Gelidibacter sp.]|nr:glycosyltransferase [Gelidibacter sp.]